MASVGGDVVADDRDDFGVGVWSHGGMPPTLRKSGEEWGTRFHDGIWEIKTSAPFASPSV